MCSIVTGFATLSQPSTNSYDCLQQSQTWLSISDFFFFFLISLLFSFHLLLLFSPLASVSVSNLHSCLTFTSCRCACMLAKSQRRWIPKGRDCFSCSLSSPGAKFTNLKSFIFACVVKKCFRCFLSAAVIPFGYIFFIILLGNILLFSWGSAYFFTRDLRTNQKCILLCNYCVNLSFCWSRFYTLIEKKHLSLELKINNLSLFTWLMYKNIKIPPIGL